MGRQIQNVSLKYVSALKSNQKKDTNINRIILKLKLRISK